jgi:hypothetical protein
MWTKGLPASSGTRTVSRCAARGGCADVGAVVWGVGCGVRCIKVQDHQKKVDQRGSGSGSVGETIPQVQEWRITAAVVPGRSRSRSMEGHTNGTSP